MDDTWPGDPALRPLWEAVDCCAPDGVDLWTELYLLMEGYGHRLVATSDESLCECGRSFGDYRIWKDHVSSAAAELLTEHSLLPAGSADVAPLILDAWGGTVEELAIACGAVLT